MAGEILFTVKKSLYNNRKLPSAVPAEPGNGLAIDKSVTNDCAATKFVIENPEYPNDFATKNDTKQNKIFCVIPYT